MTGVVQAIVELVIGVFTEVAPAVAGALVQTAEALIWTTGENATLSVLAQVCLTFAAFAIGASLLYKIFGLIRFKRNSRA